MIRNISIQGPKEKIEQLCPLLGGVTETETHCTLTGSVSRTGDNFVIYLGDVTISFNVRDLTPEDIKILLGLY